MSILQMPILLKAYQFIGKLLPNEIVVVKVHGHEMQVPLLFGMTLAFTGTYASEKLMTKIFREVVSKDMTVVDIGAHVGYYTLLARGEVGNAGTVYSFEPEPNNYSLLIQNILYNYNRSIGITMCPFRMAMSNADGIAKLYLSKSMSDHSLAGKNGQGYETVITSTMDTFFENIPVDIIKIDAEGAEFKIIQGMHKVLRANQHLVIFTEFNPKALLANKSDPMFYWAALLNSGLEISLINEQESRLEPATFENTMRYCDKLGYVNLFCRK